MERSAFVSAGYGALRKTRASWTAGDASCTWRFGQLLQSNVARNRLSRSEFAQRHLVTAVAAPEKGNADGKSKSGKRKGSEKSSPYSDTVNLPETGFGQRANAKKREPEIQEFWSTENVYERVSRENPGEKYILHDGPPFANGPVHCGHALNKNLKDFIVRYKLLRGKKATFVPGWDTHGLPIELKVLQGMKSKERQAASVMDMRERAKQFALDAVEGQRIGFRRMGVWGDWDNPYLTLRPEYEAAQIGVFGDMFLKGYVYRGFKPVHWSPSSRTALAEAELEYPEGHTSRSCYCAFRAVSAPESAPQEVQDAVRDKKLRLSVWTTTPWTMPANRAVAVNTGLSYALVAGLDPSDPSAVVVVAKELASSVTEKLAKAFASASEKSQDDGKDSASVTEPRIVTIMLGRDLVGIEYAHPLEDNKVCRVVEGGDYITTETGTGLVHTAPGHGMEDYQTGLREGLDLISPVDGAGKFTEEAANGRFKGMSVLGDGNEAVLAALGDSGILLLEEKYKHKYPYDWRTKKPTIFRATAQWFASVEGFRSEALDAIQSVDWIPASGEKRIRGMVENRGDWCLSRQRTWGLPIPVFYDADTDEPIMTPETISHVQAVFAKHGSNAWWSMDTDELLPPSLRGRNLRKGTDTMDVWFDSGTSWASVSSGRDELAYPADLYLEGSDQHRGWFQSSMLTSVATQGKPPYKAVLTHGFVLDEKGVKMSKSIGNVVDPLVVIDGGNNQKKEPPYGADVLRLWVASVDYTGDVLIGPSVMRQVSDVYRKLRNTVRYMMGNLNDYSPAEHEVAFGDLPSLDQFMLYKLQELQNEVEEAYDAFAFYRVYQALQRFAVVDLSNFYLEIAKDRLYIPEPDAYRRRSCQTVLAELLESYARMIAPIMPHMAEDVWQNLPYRPKSNNPGFPDAKSVFEGGWIRDESEKVSLDFSVLVKWRVVLELRDAANKVLEAGRVDKKLGASLDAVVTICAADPMEQSALCEMNASKNDVDDLKRALIVSGVTIVDSLDDVRACAYHNIDDSDSDGEVRFGVGVDRSQSTKCDRCWHYDDSVGDSENHPLLCARCVDAVEKMGIFTAPEATVAASG